MIKSKGHGAIFKPQNYRLFMKKNSMRQYFEKNIIFFFKIGIKTYVFLLHREKENFEFIPVKNVYRLTCVSP